MHPVQLALHPQPGLIKTGHLGLGDPVLYLVEELVQPLGCTPGHPGHGTFGHRDAEQLGQRRSGPFLGQELPRHTGRE
jgi:hypothetical protein